MGKQNRLALPDDWCEFAHPDSKCDCDHARIQAELEVELHPYHPFYGRKLRVIAHATGTDDVLCTHSDESGRYSIIHLTWGGRPELGTCPTIDFDGDWSGVCRYFGYIADVLNRVAEEERLGVREPMTTLGTSSRPIVIRRNEQNDVE